MLRLCIDQYVPTMDDNLIHEPKPVSKSKNLLTLFRLGGGGGVGPSPGFSSMPQKPFNQSSPNFVTLIIVI